MLKSLMKKIEDENIKKVGVQAPSGLKSYIRKILDKLDQKNIDYLVSANSCYGGCDLDLSMDVDLLVHMGHNKIIETKEDVFYFEYLHNISDIDKNLFKKLPKDIGVVFSINHKKNADQVIDILKSEGKNPILGKKNRRVKYPGQILGCNFKSAKSIEDKIDSYLYVGDGKFHPLGLSLSTEKKVFQFNPFENKLEEISKIKNKFLKKRYAQIEKAKSTDIFGIVSTTKIGQRRDKELDKVIGILKKNNKKYIKISADEISVDKLSEFQYIDAFIILACPRIAIDNQEMIKKPLLTVSEVGILFEDKKYFFDEIN